MNQNSQIGTRILFQNIGPVRSADLKLGDLTVIAGANNTGKTYIAHTLYGFLVFLHNMRLPSGHRLFLGPFAGIFRSVHLPMNFNKLEGGRLRVSINTDEYQKFIQKMMDYLCKNFSSGIHNVFSASEEEFANATLRQKIEFPSFSDNKVPRRNLSEFVISKSGDTFEIRRSEKQIAVVIEESAIGTDRYFWGHIKGWLVEHFLMENFSEPFCLPADRFGVSLFYKELDFAKSRLVERLQNLKDKKILNRHKQSDALISESAARYAKPIKDNIDYIRDLANVSKRKVSIMGEKIFDDIKDMMGGYYRYKDDDIYFISKKRKDEAFMIRLHLASSAAQGLSGIYFYLKHVAKKNQMLIVDEPEAYLDTENQIKMARVLARCVNAGIRVLITTHSDYMLKEFNNLIMLSSDFPEKKDFLRHHKEYRHENCFLKRKSVRAYTCTDKGGSMYPCEIDKYGMIMPVFDNTIHKINKVANTLGGYLS